MNSTYWILGVCLRLESFLCEIGPPKLGSERVLRFLSQALDLADPSCSCHIWLIDAKGFLMCFFRHQVLVLLLHPRGINWPSIAVPHQQPCPTIRYCRSFVVKTCGHQLGLTGAMAAANEVARVMAEAALLVQETYKDMAGGLGSRGGYGLASGDLNYHQLITHGRFGPTSWGSGS